LNPPTASLAQATVSRADTRSGSRATTVRKTLAKVRASRTSTPAEDTQVVKFMSRRITALLSVTTT